MSLNVISEIILHKIIPTDSKMNCQKDIIYASSNVFLMPDKCLIAFGKWLSILIPWQ
jgi:hypothetical protein